MNSRKVFVGRQDGFTIAELSVTLIAVTILLIAGVPLIDRVLDQNRVMLAAQSIASQLQYARMKSVTSNEAFRLNFPAGTNTFRIENSASEVMAGPFYLPPGITWNSSDAGNAIQFPGNYCEFIPSGNVTPSGNGSAGRAKIRNTSGVRIDIVVFTGGIIRITPAYTSPPAAF